MSFKDFWNGSGGVIGDYSFGIIHIGSMLFTTMLIIGLCIWGCRQKSSQRKIILAIAWFQIIFEVLWRVVWIIRGQSFETLYPLFPCNLAGIIIPIAAIINNNTMKKMFYIFGFIGGVLTFLVPDGIFCNNYLNFPILKSVLQHTGIILLPVVEYVFKTYIPKLKDIWLVFIGVGIHILNSEITPIIFGQTGYDYMFFRGDLPFVISGIPQWITLSVFGAIVITMFNIALDRTIFRSKKK